MFSIYEQPGANTAQKLVGVSSAVLAVLVVAIAGCSPDYERLSEVNNYVGAAAQPAQLAAVCQAAGSSHDLPSALKESSGLAQSRVDPNRFWTHNDAGNAPIIYAVSSQGSLSAQVRVNGVSSEDWEDIAAGPCGGANCLFIADIGDNSAKRSSINVYQVSEPTAGTSAVSPSRTMQARYPGGARDAEAMFVHEGDIYIVTKGRKEPIELYKWPRSTENGGTVTLGKIREVLPAPKSADDRITSGSATPDGKWVAIRSYRTIYLFSARSFLDSSDKSVTPVTSDLGQMKEPKGEGLALANDGSAWLSTEAVGKRPAAIARLQCDLPASAG